MGRPNNLSELAALVRTQREFEGLTQQQLADEIGTNRSAIAHLEQGRRLPTPGVLSSACTRLRLPEPLWSGWQVEASEGVDVRCHFVTFYTSRRNRTGTSAESERNSFVIALKNARRFKRTDAFQLAAHRIHKHFPHLFCCRTFVPVPTSRRTQDLPRSRWPGARLADALCALGVECRTEALLQRVVEVAKSSELAASERLTVGDHIDSIDVTGTALMPGLVLVDDLTTRGATMIACARLLREAGWPGAIDAVAVAYTRPNQSHEATNYSVWRFEWQGDDQHPSQRRIVKGEP